MTTEMTSKVCKGCKESKLLVLFPREKRNKDGRGGKCYDCMNLYYRQRYDKNDAVRSQRAAYREANREKQREYNKEYYQANKEGLIASVSEWQALNKAKVTGYKKKNKVSRKKGHIALSKADEQKILDFYWLAKDLQAVTGEVYHVDHIVPLCGKTICGLHVPWNLQVLPADVNIRKSNHYDPTDHC